MKLIINKNHELEGCSCLLGVDSENKSEQLIITVFDELIDKWAYLEFKTANGTKYTSERLNIVNKQITYTLPNGLLQNGYLVVQAVFRDANNYVWKSLTRQLKVAAAINAEATLPTEYPSFIADAQEILDNAQAAAQSIGGVVAGEASRVTAEATRAAAETIRGTSETARAAAETIRGSQETTRQTNEASRVTAEASRANQFNLWANTMGDGNEIMANLEAAAEGVLFNSIVDETTAYNKAVPSNALPYAKLSKLGGMSYLSKNIINVPTVVETTINGITYSITNGVLKINGNSTTQITLATMSLYTMASAGDYTFSFKINGEINENHYFMVQAYLDGNWVANIQPREMQNNICYGSKTIETNFNYLRLIVVNGTITNNFEASLIMVEKGITVPTYEPYWAGFYDAKVTSVGALTIPVAIRALDGYGKGIDVALYNYIDLEIKKFIKAVNNLDIIQSLNIDIYQDNTKTIAYRINNALETNWYLRKTICNRLNRLVTVIDDNEGYTHGDNTSTLFIRINHNKLTAYGYIESATQAVKIQAFKSWLVDNPTTIIYELAEPVETDISEYLAHKYLAANGSVTFNNTNQKAVPSKITFYKKV